MALYSFLYEAFLKLFPQESFYSENVMEEAKQHPIVYHFERFIGESPWHFLSGAHKLSMTAETGFPSISI